MVMKRQILRMSARTSVLGIALILLACAPAHAQTESDANATKQGPPPLRANGKIAFTSDRDGNLEIYVMNNDGTGQLRLTNNPGVDCFPAWSPDGGKIAFVSQNLSGTFALRMMDADGANQAEITPIAFSRFQYPWHEAWSLSWSPDGSKLAFEENGDIFAVNVDGSNRVNLTNHPAFDYEPSWSPDGSRIIFVSSRVYWMVMHTMNADGSDVQALPSSGEFWDMAPDWSPSGGKIAFVVRSEDFLPILFTANADGTNRQIFDGDGYGSQHRNKPKWSPDETKMVFHIWDFFGGDCQIYLKDVGGGELTPLVGKGRNFQPVWQPIAASP
jgi:TolB protein